MELPLNQILLGDCLELLRKLPDDCIDSVVSDPPYGLGNKDPDPMDILAFMQGSSNSLGPLKKGRKHCLNNVIGSPIVSDPDATDPQPPENRVTFSVTCASLPMKVGPIEFDRQASTGKHEVDDEGLVRQLHDILVGEVDSLIREGSGHGQLCLRKRESFSGCVETCSCFSELGNSRVRVLVWLGDDSFGQTRTAASIVATGTAELRAMLTLDLLRRTGELSLASATDECDAGLLLATTENVGTPGGAGRLPTAIKALLSCEVTPTADKALTFDVSVPRALLTRIHEPRVHQTDFMNRSWQLPSVEVWREVYRVLKPGGYVASFAGTRTFDLMSIGLRMAGFECRDTVSRFYPDVELPVLQWVQASGMPKSHSIGKAIDKKLGKTRKVVGSRPIAYPDTPSGYTSFSSKSTASKGGIWSESTGETHRGRLVTAPGSEEAAEWEGWGSALKPSWEPILLFRKPFKGTLADNVLQHGTGGLNIDATRVRHSSQADFEAHKAQVDAIKQKGGSRGKSWKNSSDLSGANEVKEGGRWPANLLLEHVPYAEWWRLRGDISELQRQEALAYYGVEQALSPMRQSDLGNAGGGGEAEVLLKDVRRTVATGTETAEDRLGSSGVHPVSGHLPGPAGMGEERASEVLLEEVSGPVELRETASLGEAPHGGSPSKDAGRRNGEVPARELEPMEGWTIPLSRGVRLRYGGSATRASAEFVSGDVEGLEAKEVHRRASSRGRGKAGPSNSERRSRAPRQRAQGGQPSGELGSRLAEGSQPSTPGNREQGSRSGGADSSFDLGEFELEVRSDLVPEHLGSLFSLVSREGCQRVGVKKVRGSNISASPNKVYTSTARKTYGDFAESRPGTYVDADGLEEVDTWACAEGCPVLELNEQSGERPSTLTGRADPNTSHRHPGHEMNPNSAFLGERTHLSRVYADGGGAARFFTQFEVEEGKGRWPSNTVWTHAEGCKLVGTQRIKAPKGGAGILWSHLRDGKTDEALPSKATVGDEEGKETIDVWQCVDGCPVKALDEQGVASGSHLAGNKAAEVNHTVGNKVYGGSFEPMRNNPDYHADDGGGGVSRFFSQFDGVPFKYVPKANRREAGCGEFEVQHITLKPVSLIRWLVKLVTRKGGVVLDMYAGSGTTPHAAILEGMKFIGMERDPVSHAEAERRLKIVLEREEERQYDQDLFEFAHGGEQGLL